MSHSSRSRCRFRGFAACIAILSSFGCSTLVQQAAPVDLSVRSLEASKFGSMQNVVVSGNVWLGSKPTPEDLDLARRREVRCIIDLSSPDEAPQYDLAAACAGHGIDYVHVGVEGKKEISEPVVDRVLAELSRDGAEHLLLICGDGSRAAMFLAIHRVVAQGTSLHEALIDARRAGMRPGFQEDFVRTQVARLVAQG